MDEEDDTDLREQLFHSTVREYVIFLLLFILLFIASSSIIGWYRRRDHDDYYSLDDIEASVYKISLLLCTFSLSVSLGGALLLPISIVSNEVLILYPNSYYVKWLNNSLIQGLWSLIFLFSNLSLFVLLPFSYLFTESEGFAGCRKCMKARILETFTVFGLLAVVVLGLTYVMSAVIDTNNSSIQTLLNLWTYYLPFLYSCISFLGVLMLLLCTPLGFVRLFSVVGRYLVKPKFLHDIQEEYSVACIEVNLIRRRLERAQETGQGFMVPQPMGSMAAGPMCEEDEFWNKLLTQKNGELFINLQNMLQAALARKCKLDKQRKASPLQRNFLYPIAMMLLIALTSITVLTVIQNSLSLSVGMKALPLSTQQFTLGISSLSMLGPYGAALEIVLICYLVVTSSIGLYTLPYVKNIRPKKKDTSFAHLIVNCTLVLILSTALPLLSRILGITNLDLLGDFGRIEWLGNFKLVLLYNLVFAGAFTLCLVNKFTASVRRDLYARLESSLLTLLNIGSESKPPAQRSPKVYTYSGKED